MVASLGVYGVLVLTQSDNQTVLAETAVLSVLIGTVLQLGLPREALGPPQEAPRVRRLAAGIVVVGLVGAYRVRGASVAPHDRPVAGAA